MDRCGKKIRYLVDFYDGAGLSKTDAKDEPQNTSIYIDVRPEIATTSFGEGFQSAWDRFRVALGFC